MWPAHVPGFWCDALRTWAGPAGGQHADYLDTEPAALGSVVVLSLRRFVLANKPPGWELDSDGAGACSSGIPVAGAPRPFSLLVQPGRDATEFGFVTRLDSPGSGLIATTRGAHAHAVLMCQASIYQIGRSYCVVCGGADGGTYTEAAA